MILSLNLKTVKDWLFHFHFHSHCWLLIPVDIPGWVLFVDQLAVTESLPELVYFGEARMNKRKLLEQNEPLHEKSFIPGFRPGPTQIRLYSH